tara:strand:+ start:2130 stop:3074 length:945 start_codon:yes stop_codon:yes gene_type:complete
MGEKFEWGDHRLEPMHLAGWGLHQNLQDAEVYCSQIADAHYENFLIANKFTPPNIRQHIQNIYAFCRYGDDLGDEAPFDSQGRLKLLEAWEKDLAEAHQSDWSGKPQHPILIAVQYTAKTFNIPLEPFWKLIQAFKMDQTKNRYQSWDELLDYCQHSADPVGHLFLYVYGHDNEELRTLSDKTCTALQLANHWQDISRDWQQNRSYLPEETMQRFGVDWNRYGPEYVDENWKSMLSFEVERAQKLFDEGKKLWKLVDAHLAVDLMMFTKGGEAILQAIRNQKFDTWKKRPKVSKLKQVRLYFKAKAEWKRASRG